MSSKDTNSKYERNYQLDFLKLMFAFLVIISHTGVFIGENTKFSIPNGLGFICVHFFFVVSGMLMVCSYKRNKEPSSEIGKASLIYVVNKFKKMALPIWIALAIRLIVHIIIYDSGNWLQYTLRSVFEVFAVHGSGINGGSPINGPTWYISSLLIVMLPLYYLMCKNKDFFIYVFAPLGAVLSIGYMAMMENPIVPVYSVHGFVIGALIRAFCGICFGVVAWLISDWLQNSERTNKIAITTLEILLYGVFFVVLLMPNQQWICLYGIMIILPIALAITMSGKSVLGKLFTGKAFSLCGSVSLAIYLNQDSALKIVEKLLPKMSYKMSILAVFVIIAGICLIYYAVIKVIKTYGVERRTK